MRDFLVHSLIIGRHRASKATIPLAVYVIEFVRRTPGSDTKVVKIEVL